ncbi:hypothetical protein DFJ43DRAFT_472640 [Lentinula guzmanii]|uniref:Secreted protein n=1 Tax=Lentinula guzmanii TaxID=2804957 RepID=A0AA38JG67_9AGAR|nr:hypothetical protein DFJ43DRAFT_472640 [Lentinula guzmanii]
MVSLSLSLAHLCSLLLLLSTFCMFTITKAMPLTMSNTENTPRRQWRRAGRILQASWCNISLVSLTPFRIIMTRNLCLAVLVSIGALCDDED